MKHILLGAVLASLFLFSGCASAPTDTEIQNADYGSPVGNSDCIGVAKTYIASLMKDPGSTQFAGVKCFRGWAPNVPVAGVSATFGYVVQGSVNAKNSFGAYTGFTSFQGVVRDDGYGPRLVRYCLSDKTEYGEICIPRMVGR